MKIDWKLIVAIVALLIAIFGFFGGGIWRTSDVVFDKRAVEIPLSDSLRSYIGNALAAARSGSATAKRGIGSSGGLLPNATLPDKLLYVNIRNVGHVPSATIKVRIVLPGQIADKTIKDAGSAFGTVSQLNESDSTGELSFECQNLSNHPQARIQIALWYQENRSGVPSVDIQDTGAGVAREVPSTETARFYLWELMSSDTATTIMGLVLGILSFVSAFWIARLQKRKKKSLHSEIALPNETTPENP
jgi:hypothetical protein